MKTRPKKVEQTYKNCKSLFEQIKKRPKKLHISNLIRIYKNNTKMAWSVIKEAIDKNLPQKSPNKINSGSKFIMRTDSIAENFNKYFTEIGQNLANRISSSLVNFGPYLNKMCNIFQPEMLSTH